jgi:hypothetical protein
MTEIGGDTKNEFDDMQRKKSDSTHIGDDFSASAMNVDPNSSRWCEFVLAEKIRIKKHILNNSIHKRSIK